MTATSQRRPIGPHADRRAGKPRGLAARIVRRRLALALSQSEAAEALGIHPVTLARWEAALAAPRGLYASAVLAWLRGEGR